MNEGQRRRIAIEMETAIAVPVIFESDNGVIELIVPTGFGTTLQARMARVSATIPSYFEFEMVRIDANGKVLSRRPIMYEYVGG